MSGRGRGGRGRGRGRGRGSFQTDVMKHLPADYDVDVPVIDWDAMVSVMCNIFIEANILSTSLWFQCGKVVFGTVSTLGLY